MASESERAAAPPVKTGSEEPAKPEPAPAQAGRFPKVTGGGIGREWNDGVLDDVLRAVTPSHEQDGGALKPSRETTFAAYMALYGIGSEDVIGDMVAAQLYVAHKAAMDCYQKANTPGISLELWRERMNQANKLSRTSVALIEALNRHRGKTGQQTVRVEHVTVKDGGQAVIGPVSGVGTGGRGEG